VVLTRMEGLTGLDQRTVLVVPAILAERAKELGASRPLRI